MEEKTSTQRVTVLKSQYSNLFIFTSYSDADFLSSLTCLILCKAYVASWVSNHSGIKDQVCVLLVYTALGGHSGTVLLPPHLGVGVTVWGDTRDPFRIIRREVLCKPDTHFSDFYDRKETLRNVKRDIKFNQLHIHKANQTLMSTSLHSEVMYQHDEIIQLLYT